MILVRRARKPVLIGLPAAAVVIILCSAVLQSWLPPATRTNAPAASVAAAPATSSPSPVPTPPPRSTAAPSASPYPPADSFPLVNSCDPASVPGSIPVPAAPAAPAATGSFTLRVPILEYHRVVPANEAGNSLPGLVVPPENFAAQLELFEKRGWRTITMAALADDLAAHVAPPAKTFVITFDDGWDDGYTYALPLLAQHGYVGTFFVISSRIDRPGFLTSDHLRALVAAGDEIGDHTFDHASLSSIKSDQVPREIDGGASRIAQVTGRWPESLAYPYGGTNSRVAQVVAACQGLRIAALDGPMKVTTQPSGPGHGASPSPSHVVLYTAYETWANRFEVPRIRVGPGATASSVISSMERAAAG